MAKRTLGGRAFRLKFARATAGFAVAVVAIAAAALASPSGAAAANGQIAYSRYSQALLVANPDATGVRELTPDTYLYFLQHPSWSPDGSKIAFEGNDPVYGNLPEIYVMTADGTGVQQLTTSAGFLEHREPAWSPDGTKIAFSGGTSSGDRDIYVMNAADGSNVVDLSNSSGRWDDEPAWSPDGSKIVFVGNSRSPYRDRDSFLYVMKADGSNQVQLTQGPLDRQPAWSPDGTKIALARYIKDQDPASNAIPDIYVINAVDGSGATDLTQSPNVDDISPSWSPDGTRIAFMSDRDARIYRYDVYTMSSSGGDMVDVSCEPADDSWPGWGSNTTPLPPTPCTPYGVTASPLDDGSIRLQWTAPVDHGTPITEYLIHGSDGSNQTVDGTATSATISGLTKGTDYVFWVTASNGQGGVSARSDPSNDVISGSPPAPVHVRATAGDRSATVSWETVSDGASPITGFTISDTSGDFSTTAGPDARTATVGGLFNGETYTFTVTATNAYGTSNPSAPSNAVTPGAGPPPGFVTRDGTRLLLEGQPYRPIGLNIYNANSNGWCWYAMGGSILDDSLTAIGAGKNAMRAWFFQQLATTNGSRDWTAFDRTLATARAHGYKVIATLIDQWGNCGATNGQGYGYKDQSWYESGYKQPDPSATVSYRDWVQEVAARYKNDPTILAWQLVNEPQVLVPPCQLVNGEITCAGCDEPTAESDLSSFATDVADLIKAQDPNHLVSLGTIGSGQCGAQYTDYQRVMSIPSLDLCEFHDYEYQHPMPGDQWNGLQLRINQCNELGKPLLVGELGVKPNQVGGTLKDRANVVAGKLCAQLRAGVAGELLWAWDKNGSLLDNFDIGPSDPVLDVLSPWSDPTHSCSAPAAPSGVVAAAGDGSAALSWVAPASDGGSPVTSYTVTSNPGGVTKTVGGSTTSATVTGLSNGTSYTFTVTATNVVGTSGASAASAAVVPKSGNVAAAGIASGTESTTVSTGSDPAATGGVTSSVTVPAGTSGAVTVTQTATSEPAPSGYQFGGVQIDISAPTATPSNPLTLVFTAAPPAGAPVNDDTLLATEVFRAEGSGAPQAIATCTGTGADPTPACVSDRRYVTIGGSTYIRVTVLATSASHWNSARPGPAAVVVSNTGYAPANVTVQPAGRVNWTFAGSKAHSVTDASGLGDSGKPWFDSGAKTSGSFSFAFPAAGTYSYKSTVKGDTMSGSVLVPAVIGHPSSTYVVIWAAGKLTGYAFDVQYRFRPAGSTKWGNWVSWKSTTNPNATFTPMLGGGTYSFQARLRNMSTGKYSGYSPQAQLTIP